jgi:hypothetical protein
MLCHSSQAKPCGGAIDTLVMRRSNIAPASRSLRQAIEVVASVIEYPLRSRVLPNSARMPGSSSTTTIVILR